MSEDEELQAAMLLSKVEADEEVTYPHCLLSALLSHTHTQRERERESRERCVGIVTVSSRALSRSKCFLVAQLANSAHTLLELLLYYYYYTHRERERRERERERAEREQRIRRI